jgi:hypothetical protein
MREVLLFIGVMAIWFTMVRWVLPYFGIATCCCAGNACRFEGEDTAKRGEVTDQQISNSEEAKR